MITLMRLAMRVFGIRTVESPETVRVTVPRWMLRLMPDVLEETRRKVLRDHPTAYDVRITNRSVIARLR